MSVQYGRMLVVFLRSIDMLHHYIYRKFRLMHIILSSTTMLERQVMVKMLLLEWVELKKIININDQISIS